MSIKSNMQDLRPRREKYKREITLPSGGYANPTAFPGGKVTIYPWDSKTDEWLQTQSRTASPQEQDALLYSVTEQLCNLNGCKLDDFVLGDVFTVLLVARSVQNDSILEYTARCDSCNHPDHTKLKVPDELEPLGVKDAGYGGFDTITLPECKDVVTVRPLRIGDERKITSRTPENKQVMSDHVARILAPVKTINNTEPDNRAELLTWYEALSPKDAAFLEEQEDALTPHLNLTLQHQCERCKNKYEFTLVLNREFFRSGRFTKPGAEMATDI